MCARAERDERRRENEKWWRGKPHLVNLKTIRNVRNGSKADASPTVQLRFCPHERRSSFPVSNVIGTERYTVVSIIALNHDLSRSEGRIAGADKPSRREAEYAGLAKVNLNDLGVDAVLSLTPLVQARPTLMFPMQGSSASKPSI